MRCLVAASSALCASLFCFAVHAQESIAAESTSSDVPPPAQPGQSHDGPRGFELGARLGFGVPLGDLAEKKSLDKDIGSQLPVWIDAGYRVTPNIYVGAYGQLGYLLLKDRACTAPVECSALDWKIGANVHYHFQPTATFDPWIGAGVGYEWFSIRETNAGKERSGGVRGFELVNLQVGGDYRLSEQAGIGPFASFSLGQYDTASLTQDGQTKSADIKQTALHEWLTFGVRGVFDL
jgi:opacity protein-like surface antigen